MELHEIIRVKRFDSETHHKLLEIARGNNVVEDLLDLIFKLKEKDNTDVDVLESTIIALKSKIEAKDLELAGFHKQINESSKSLNEFIEKTKNEKDRYPSFDEAWSESENRFLKHE